MSETVFDLVDESGVVRFRGTTVPPVAAAAPVTLTLGYTSAGIGYEQTIANDLHGGDDVGGDADTPCVLTQPVAFAAGVVVATGDATLEASGVVPTTDVAFIIALSLYVTDQTGTNVATGAATATVAAPVTDISESLDLSGVEWEILEGLDLSDGGDGTLVSAAGGVYSVAIRPSAVFDV